MSFFKLSSLKFLLKTINKEEKKKRRKVNLIKEEQPQYRNKKDGCEKPKG